jgi:hypothetical protein
MVTLWVNSKNMVHTVRRKAEVINLLVNSKDIRQWIVAAPLSHQWITDEGVEIYRFWARVRRVA